MIVFMLGLIDQPPSQSLQSSCCPQTFHLGCSAMPCRARRYVIQLSCLCLGSGAAVTLQVLGDILTAKGAASDACVDHGQPPQTCRTAVLGSVCPGQRKCFSGAIASTSPGQEGFTSAEEQASQSKLLNLDLTRPEESAFGSERHGCWDMLQGFEQLEHFTTAGAAKMWQLIIETIVLPVRGHNTDSLAPQEPYLNSTTSIEANFLKLKYLLNHIFLAANATRNSVSLSQPYGITRAFQIRQQLVWLFGFPTSCVLFAACSS